MSLFHGFQRPCRLEASPGGEGPTSPMLLDLTGTTKGRNATPWRCDERRWLGGFGSLTVRVACQAVDVDCSWRSKAAGHPSARAGGKNNHDIPFPHISTSCFVVCLARCPTTPGVLDLLLTNGRMTFLSTYVHLPLLRSEESTKGAMAVASVRRRAWSTPQPPDSPNRSPKC